MLVCAAWLALTLAGPAVARGQILPPDDPPPSSSIASPPGEATAYNGNPSRTGVASEERVFGPLYTEWERRFEGPVGAPLVARGRVVITKGSPGPDVDETRILALDPSTGEVIWSYGPLGAEWTGLAYADGVLVAVTGSRSGPIYVRAFSLETGALLWMRTLTGHNAPTTPVAHAGTVYFTADAYSAGELRLYALALASGANRWFTEIGSSYVELALDNARVFVGLSCGDAYAIYRHNGQQAWPGPFETFDCPHGSRGPVAGGRLFSGEGTTFDAATGEARGTLAAGQPQVVAGGLGFRQSREGLHAFRLADGSVLWSRGHELPRNAEDPLLAGGTLYAPAGGDRIVGYEPSTGEILSRTRVPAFGYTESQGGLAAAAGRLFFAASHNLVSLRPVLRPPAGGVDFAASSFDVSSGERVHFVAGVDPALREGRPPVTLQRDPHPAGAWHADGTVRTNDDGTAYFTRAVRKNTRYRPVLDDGTAGPALPVFAYARYRLRLEGAGAGVVAARTKLLGVASDDARGGRMVAYLGDRRRGRLRLVGGDRLEPTGPRSAKATIRFKVPPRTRASDVVAICVPGLPRRGYGRNVGFAKRCGASSLPSRLLRPRPAPAPAGGPAARPRAAAASDRRAPARARALAAGRPFSRSCRGRSPGRACGPAARPRARLPAAAAARSGRSGAGGSAPPS